MTSTKYKLPKNFKFVPIETTRCGTCKHFHEHTCKRNDLYLNKGMVVQEDFASKCNLYEKVKP